MNLIEKYLAKAAGKEHVAPGQDLTCKVSFVAAHDVTAPIAIRMFREIGVKKVFDPSRVAPRRHGEGPRQRLGDGRLLQGIRRSPVSAR